MLIAATDAAPMKSPKSLRNSSRLLWSRLMLFTTATLGRYSAIEPSLSSTSETNTSPVPTRALAKGASGATKFFITAPFIMVGSRPQRVKIQPIIPVTVLLPDVPPTAMEVGAALTRRASICARLMRAAPNSRARTTSGTLSSTAAEATRTCAALVMPLPSCGNILMPRLWSHANFSGVRPASKLRSDPAISAPSPFRISAKGNIPDPPMPQKNHG